MAGVVAAAAARAVGVPVLIAFLGLGMLVGVDGPGQLDFDDAETARLVGTVGLAAILFEGGLDARWKDVRPVVIPAALLGTVGVILTAAIAGVAAYVLLDLSLTEALLLGAIVGSTDAAAVFATFRFRPIKRRLRGLLEAESGLNDPMAVALTIGFIELATVPSADGFTVVQILARELGIGLAVGVAAGLVAWIAVPRFPAAVADFAPVGSMGFAALAFGVADVAGGSGFLAIYLAGLAVGNAPGGAPAGVASFHRGGAFLAQVVMFGVLGLLVSPSQLVAVIPAGLALAAVLMLVARPVAVVTVLAPLRYPPKELALMSWAGLRGAVPIVLATFVLTEPLIDRDEIFNAVFFVVLVSALVQGSTLSWFARVLGLRTRPEPDPPGPGEPSRSG